MKAAILIFCIALSVLPAFSQTADGAWTLGPNWSYNRNLSNTELARIAMQGASNKRLLNGAQGKFAAKKKVVATGPTSYKATAGYLLPKLLSDQADGTADEKLQVKKAIEESLKFYENIAYLKEYPSNDVSFALLYYLINNYVIYRNIDPAATDVSGRTQFLVGGFYSPLYAHEQAVFTQLSRQLTANRNFATLGDAEKQKIAETLAIYTTLLWYQFQALTEKRDMKGLGQIRQLAASNVEGFTGAKIEVIDIGANGIVIVK